MSVVKSLEGGDCDGSADPERSVCRATGRNSVHYTAEGTELGLGIIDGIN